MNWKLALTLISLLVSFVPGTAASEHSVARQWNEELIRAIRKDFARPTVHARNLFHVSVAMYDAWAAYDEIASPFLLGRTVGGFTCPFVGVPAPAVRQAAREEAVSFAAYRLLRHRFQRSPGAGASMARFDSLMAFLGYDTSNASTDYTTGSPASLGNYVASKMIAFGMQDGSNEQGRYANLRYQPINPPMAPTLPGNSTILFLNRWQPLTLDFIDQSGNVFPRSTPAFLSAEWGQVIPFALTPADRTIYTRGAFDYWVYHDPGMPPQLDSLNNGGPSDEYKWNFELVSIWGSHLDASDGVLWDISPASIGNVQQFPRTPQEYRNFYRLEGGDNGTGHTLNPRTGQPYAPNVVPRGDYARVLAEFWADGLDSETPPGHWFSILNYVGDHALFQKRMRGQGPVIDDLEWDIKAYFILGGAMHDAAVAAWGIKGWYDYVRPVSAIRAMCRLGQSSSPASPNYHPAGMRLVPGYVELIGVGDPLAGFDGENVGKVKLRTWRAHEFISDPRTTVAGSGWILASKWWPYQRPTFVTPPFAGYVSGHSTFSRAAAEVLTQLTGDEFFPGGLGEFHAPRNELLVFEDGPSVDVTLQWATYRDASDQTSLSRIWGGIHPPADDIPGRRIGAVIGPAAFGLAEKYFDGSFQEAVRPRLVSVLPNPVNAALGALTVELSRPAQQVDLELYDVRGRRVGSRAARLGNDIRFVNMDVRGLEAGVYFLRVAGDGWESTNKVCLLR